MLMKRLKLVTVILIVIFALSMLSSCFRPIRDGLNATGLPIPDPITTSFNLVEVFASGGGGSFALTACGILLAWGRVGASFEELEVELPIYRPTKIMDDVIAVSIARAHAMVITSDGVLWGWGNNGRGQLGDGTTTSRSVPTRIMEDVIYVSAEDDRAMAITSDGTLWAWGSNRNGQLRDGTAEDRHSPVKIDESAIAVSTDSAKASIFDNALWMWGNRVFTLEEDTNGDFQIPIRDAEDVIYILVEDSLGITPDKNIGVWRVENKPRRMRDDVVYVSEGIRTFVMLTSDGTLWGLGRNTNGTLGDGTTRDRREPIKIMENVISVSTSGEHTLAVTSDGNLWAWGENALGQLGIGNNQGQYEDRTGVIQTYWLSPVLVMEYVPEGYE